MINPSFSDEQKVELFNRFSRSFLHDMKAQFIAMGSTTGAPISVDPQGPALGPTESYLIIKLGNVPMKLSLTRLSDTLLQEYLSQTHGPEL